MQPLAIGQGIPRVDRHRQSLNVELVPSIYGYDWYGRLYISDI